MIHSGRRPPRLAVTAEDSTTRELIVGRRRPRTLEVRVSYLAAHSCGRLPCPAAIGMQVTTPPAQPPSIHPASHHIDLWSHTTDSTVGSSDGNRLPFSFHQKDGNKKRAWSTVERLRLSPLSATVSRYDGSQALVTACVTPSMRQ